MRALAADRQVAAMPQPAIAAQILETFDVERNLAPQVALDDVVAVDHFADLQDLGVGELRHPPLRRQMHLLHDLPGDLRADAVDVLQRDQDALVGRDVDTSDTGHDDCSLCRRAPAIPKISPSRTEGSR
jgi:hypothetical protein